VTITTTRFGRLGAGAALRGAPKPDIWASDEAAAALGAATGWNRTPSAPSLKSLPPAETPVDDWTPTAKPAPAAASIAPTPSLMALLFSSQGRIRRRDYWIVGALAMTISLLSLVALAVSLPLQQALIGALPVVVVYGRIRTCLRIKRWHDRDKGAVWCLIVMLPMVGSLWAFVECGFLEGTSGPNRFGPPPK
jgi:uncharacterized membrane protein YhaH (DUF805 family)